MFGDQAYPREGVEVARHDLSILDMSYLLTSTQHCLLQPWLVLMCFPELSCLGPLPCREPTLLHNPYAGRNLNLIELLIIAKLVESDSWQVYSGHFECTWELGRHATLIHPSNLHSCRMVCCTRWLLLSGSDPGRTLFVEGTH